MVWLYANLINTAMALIAFVVGIKPIRNNRRINAWLDAWEKRLNEERRHE